ncbi:glycosyltransferase [Ningiella sp. W23]|uniref:glycosyltransferase n=1 Tax=Ningiella sp. W23 TaxID=3023715 RepID=UPI0037575109
MSNAPKVSVITGYYNRADVLERTILSIMNQTFVDFEFIIFNDCSTDNTQVLLDDLVKGLDDNRVVVVHHEQNKGFVQGMIDAVNIAKGQYICVQGSGDISEPARLEEQSAVLDANSNIAVVGSYYSNVVEENGAERERKKVSDDISFEQLQKENYFSHGEVMFRRTHYEQAGGYRAQFVNCQDYDLWLRMIKFGQFFTVKKNLYKRFVRTDGVSYNPKSFLNQSRYFFLAKDMSKLKLEEQAQLLSRVDSSGIEDLYSLEESRIQSRMFKAVLRSAVWGYYETAKELARVGVTSALKRVFLLTFIGLYGSKIGAPVRTLVNKKFGIE